MNLTLLAVIALAVLCLILLGNWQMHRLEWKNTLVSSIEARAYSEPVEAPFEADWPDVSAATHAYLRVRAAGKFLPEHSLKVKALTELGAGSWVLTPLQRPNGEILWINRGFLPTGKPLPQHPGQSGSASVSVTGLLRMSEPKGTLLQDNDPQKNRWYSRDVDAFSEFSGLPAPAPYFIDADHLGAQGSWPRGGMTRLNFRNNHLQYALTWYAMALLLATGTGYLIWLARRR